MQGASKSNNRTAVRKRQKPDKVKMARQCRTTEQRKNPNGYCADGSAAADKNACWGRSPEQIPLPPSEARAAGVKRLPRGLQLRERWSP